MDRGGIFDTFAVTYRTGEIKFSTYTLKRFERGYFACYKIRLLDLAIMGHSFGRKMDSNISGSSED